MADDSTTYESITLEGTVPESWFDAKDPITYNPGVSLVGTDPSGKSITITLPTYKGYTLNVTTATATSLDVDVCVTSNGSSAGCIEGSNPPVGGGSR